MLRTLFAGSILVGSLLAPSALAAQVWVVDINGGPSADFAQVQDAVAAASDGDTILVRAGTYDAVAIANKSVRIVARSQPNGQAETVTIKGVTVTNLGPTKEVLLSGLRSIGEAQAGYHLSLNQGRVWFEDCYGEGSKGNGVVADPDFQAKGYAGLYANASLHVVLERCQMVGGDGFTGYSAWNWIHGDGGPGAYFLDSAQTVIHGSEFNGGDAGTPDGADFWTKGKNGGHGLSVFGGEMFLHDVKVTGGDGGVGHSLVDAQTGQVACGNGGDGGHGLDAAVVFIDHAALTATAGVEGPPATPGCVPGVPGDAILSAWANIKSFDLAPFALDAPATVSSGDVATFSVDSFVQAPSWLWLGFAPTMASHPAAAGKQLVAAQAGLLVPMGLTPAALDVTVPGLPVTPTWFYVQAVGLDTSGTFVLGQEQRIVVLPPGL